MEVIPGRGCLLSSGPEEAGQQEAAHGQDRDPGTKGSGWTPSLRLLWPGPVDAGPLPWGQRCWPMSQEEPTL